MKRSIRIAAIVGLLAVTVVAAAYYIHRHPEVLHQLRDTSPLALILLTVLYLVWFVALQCILAAQLAFLGARMSLRENLLLNAYSSLVNFFGPGQSGPGVRAVYLKRKHHIRLRDFMLATLLYYASFAIVSAAFLLIGSRPWWQSLLGVIAASGASYGVIALYQKRGKQKKDSQERTYYWRLGWLIFAATFAQVCIQAVIYGAELHSLGESPSIGQVISYTGAANFAMFVALTPGAIGFREAFLAFSTSLHHISGNSIVAANVIDRAVYLIFLGILAIITASLHTGRYFSVRSAAKHQENNSNQKTKSAAQHS